MELVENVSVLRGWSEHFFAINYCFAQKSDALQLAS